MSNMTKVPQMITYPGGTQRYWIDEGEIGVIVVSGNLNREGIDEMTKALLDSIAEANDPKHAYLIYHMEKLGNLPPAARKAANDIFSSIDGSYLTLALILRDSLIHNLLGLFLNGLKRLFSNRLTYRIFRDETTALLWIRSEKSKHTPSS